VDGAPVSSQITRKYWYVLGLVATSQSCKMGRKELTDAVWPLSDDKSQSVLLYTWRRSVMTAISTMIADTPIIITEDAVSIDTTFLAIDYQECCSLARIVFTSDDAQTVLDAGTAFDAIAEDKVLLPSLSAAFVELREQFDKQRTAVLRRTWQAEAHLQPTSQSLTSTFELRLRNLGDENPIGTPALPFTALPEISKAPTRKGIVLSAAAQLAASVVLGIIIASPIVIGSLSTPRKPPVGVVLGSKVHKPTTDLSRRLIFQLSEPGIKRSSGTAMCMTTKNQIIVAGDAILANGDHQLITVMLSPKGKAQWVTKRSDEKGITSTPKQVFSTESGRIYVASELIADRSNARNLAPGRYLGVTVFTRDGQRIFERIHPAAIDGTALHPIKLTTDLKGGIHAFAISAGNHATLALHIPAGPPTSIASPLTGFPKSFRITDAITDDNNGRIFLLGYVPVKTSAGERLDWHVQAFDKASNTLWSRDMTGAIGKEVAPIRGTFNADGDVVAYGPLPPPNQQNSGRQIASMITLSASIGNVILRDCFDTNNQNLNFALCRLAIGKAAVLAITKQKQDGSVPLTIHRLGVDGTDTSLTLTIGFPSNTIVDGIVSFYFDQNGALTTLLKPSVKSPSTSALTYMSMFFGREISTGSLSASVPYGYNTGGGGLVAGHYNNTLCVYDFRKLP